MDNLAGAGFHRGDGAYCENAVPGAVLRPKPMTRMGLLRASAELLSIGSDDRRMAREVEARIIRRNGLHPSGRGRDSSVMIEYRRIHFKSFTNFMAMRPVPMDAPESEP